MADGLLNKASIILTPTGYKAGTLYNVAPVVEPYEDFDFARASVASRVNSSGLVEMVGRTLSSELVTNGDFATDSDWTKNDWVISNGVATLPTTSTSNLNQAIGLVQDKFYKIVFTVSNTTLGGVRVRLGTGTISSVFTDGTHTIYLEQTTTNDAFRFYADSSGVFNGSIDNVSVKEIIDTNNIPRISYDSNGDNGHILLEPTSTNLITYSEDFEQWTEEANIDVTNNSITSPDGTQNAAKLQLTGSSGGTDGKISFAVSPSATTHTFSVFAKKGNHDYIYIWMNISGGTNITRWIDLDDGSVNVGSGTATVTTTSFSNDWWKIEYTFDATNFTGVRLEVADDGLSTGTGGDNIYVWGAQLEALSYATSYIPTLTGSQETRATETATGAGSATLINSTEGVLYAEIAKLDDDTDIKGISLGQTGTDVTINGITFYFLTSNLRARAYDSDYTQNAGVYFEATKSSISTNTFYKVAISWDSNGGKMYVDGALITPTRNLSGYGFAANYFNSLNFYRNSNDVFEGKVKALAVFNEALSDDELNNLTG